MRIRGRKGVKGLLLSLLVMLCSLLSAQTVGSPALGVAADKSRIGSPLIRLASLSSFYPLVPPVRAASRKKPKMTAEELVARHLQSIGPAEARAARAACIANGTVKWRALLGGGGYLSGPMVLLSQENRVSLSMQFDHPSYSGEHFVFDGDKIHVDFMKPGVRSALGELVLVYDKLLREGLLGGVLSTAWPLASNRDVKLKYGGLRKIDGVKLHELGYRMRSSLEVRLYFERETFRHRQTFYKLTIGDLLAPNISEPYRSRDQAPVVAGIPLDGSWLNSSQGETRVRLKERFSQFTAVGGLDLPTQWQLQFTVDTPRATSLWEWAIELENITPNPRIDPEFFAVD